MRNLLLYSIIASLSAADFLPAPAAAKKNKTAAAKPAAKKSIGAQTTSSAKPIVTKAPVQRSSDLHTPSAMDQAVLNEINTARREPQKYIAYLEDYKKLFKGKTIFLPNYLRIETIEGVAPVDEAIEFLKKVSGLKPYAFSNGLNKAASFQLKDLIADSSIGHTSKDGANLPTRLKKFGSFGNLYAENIAYYAESPRDVVLRMIIDDGVKSRSHRRNIFSPDFKVIGIAFGKGKSGEGLCVVDFADQFNEPNQKLTVTQEY